jgi:cytidylate kinase
MSAAELIVVTGPPGAGKSTVAQLLAEEFPRSALVSGDAFFAFVSGGWVAPWLPEAQQQNEVVLQAAASAAARFATGRYTVVYDGVVGPWFLPTFSAATGLDGLSYVVLLPPERHCLERVAGRSGHGFRDADATRRMYRQFAEADVAERHVLRDPAGPPAAVARSIRDRLQDGVLRWER